jgi:hypothetical protein
MVQDMLALLRLERTIVYQDLFIRYIALIRQQIVVYNSIF